MDKEPKAECNPFKTRNGSYTEPNELEKTTLELQRDADDRNKNSRNDSYALSGENGNQSVGYNNTAFIGDQGEPSMATDSPNTNTDVEVPSEGKTQEDAGGRFKFGSMTRRQKFLLLFCLTSQFLAGSSFSLLAPFFPKEASKKGMSDTLIGFSFSVFELMIFITSPFFGAYLTKIGPNLVFMSGVFLGGSCNILFGVLDKSPSGIQFDVICVACRAVEAFGFSAYITAMLAIMNNEFHKDVATSFALLEAANGVGMMVGPVIGGVLYGLGGFGLPFYTIGCLVLVNGVLIYFFIPKIEKMKKTKAVSKWKLARSPLVYIGMLSIGCATMGISFLQPTLAKHLEPFSLSVPLASLFFVIAPALYTVCSPIWGYLVDRKGLYKQAIVFGAFIFGVGMMVTGPSPFLTFLHLEIWTMALGLVLMGCSFGALLISPIKCMTMGAISMGFEENLETHGVVVGLLNATYSAGAFLGPMLGGILIENFGFAIGFTSIGLVNIGMSAIALLFFAIKSCCRPSKEYDMSAVEHKGTYLTSLSTSYVRAG